MSFSQKQALKLALDVHAREPGLKLNEFLVYFGSISQVLLLLWLFTMAYKYQKLMYFWAVSDKVETELTLKQLASDEICNANYYKAPLKWAFRQAVNNTPLIYEDAAKGGLLYFFCNLPWFIYTVLSTVSNFFYYAIMQLFDGGKFAMEYATTNGAKMCFDIRKIAEHKGSYNFGDAEYWACSSACLAHQQLSNYEAFLVSLGLKEKTSKENLEQFRYCMDGVDGCNPKFFSKFVSPPGFISRLSMFIIALNYIWNITQFLFIILPSALSPTYSSYVVEAIASLPKTMQILMYVSLLSPIG